MTYTEFLPPVIRDRNKNLKLAWYVEFSFLNPQTGKMKRFRQQGNANSFTCAEKRYEVLNKILDHWNQRIYKEGFNPFLNQTEKPLHRKFFSTQVSLMEIIDEKKTYQQHTSYRDSKSRIKMFVRWLQLKNLAHLKPDKITKGHISDFLRYLSTEKGVSNRTRNNYLIELRSCFKKMKDLEILPQNALNPCDSIGRVPARSQKHMLYSNTEMKRMQHWMEKNDPALLLFTRHIIMGLRPIEIVRLQVNQYDLDEWFIKVWASGEKTGTFKRKLILEAYQDQFEQMELHKYPGQFYMFTSKGLPGPVPTTRDFFSKRFAVMKKELGLSKQHTMYGLRHTTIIALVKAGLNHVDIMKYSGHKNLSAFQAYVQQYLDDENIPDVGKKLSFIL